MPKSDSPYTIATAILDKAAADALKVPFRLGRPRPVILSPVQAAHRDMILALSQENPHTVIGHAADRFDVMDANDHIRQVLEAVTNYVKVIVADIAWYSPVNIPDETGLLTDAASDICGALNNACEHMLELQADAAE